MPSTLDAFERDFAEDFVVFFVFVAVALLAAVRLAAVFFPAVLAAAALLLALATGAFLVAFFLADFLVAVVFDDLIFLAAMMFLPCSGRQAVPVSKLKIEL